MKKKLSPSKEQNKKKTCQHYDRHGNAVVVMMDGAEISPHKFILDREYHNVTVKILKCSACGEESIGWEKESEFEGEYE